ncbi:MAG: hypothetical protein Q9195_008180, partial [Heterodermia aff. obscurata]
MSARKARYPADMIACWASMCNLAYEYRESDDVLTALRKAIFAIRNHGICVYNFQADVVGSSAEVDVDFLTYAQEQPLRHVTFHAFTLGAPCFTGVADFAQHLVTSLDEKHMSLIGTGVTIRRIVRASIENITPAEDRDKVAAELERIKTGFWDFNVFDVVGFFLRIEDVAM